MGAKGVARQRGHVCDGRPHRPAAVLIWQRLGHRHSSSSRIRIQGRGPALARLSASSRHERGGAGRAAEGPCAGARHRQQQHARIEAALQVEGKHAADVHGQPGCLRHDADGALPQTLARQDATRGKPVSSAGRTGAGVWVEGNAKGDGEWAGVDTWECHLCTAARVGERAGREGGW